ncbi:MAG: transposase, partial [Planctomycetota bacterium]|nr:transposase [Planctomycetota bacterium]
MVRPPRSHRPDPRAHLFRALPRARTPGKKNALVQLLDHSVRCAQRRGLIEPHPQIAGDGTGLEAGHVSYYFRRKTEHRRRALHFPKLTLCADLDSHFIVAVCLTEGPSRDTREAPDLLRQAHRRVKFRRALWDAGADAEAIHRLIREELGAHSVIPPKSGPKTRRWPPTEYRRQMRRRFFHRVFGQRWQAESVFSRFKRCLGSELRSVRWKNQESEALLRTVVHNLALLALWIFGLFNRA